MKSEMVQYMTIKEIQGIIKDFESSSLMSLELEMDNFKSNSRKTRQTSHCKGRIVKKKQ
jgi:hypothetical protein